MTTVEQIQTFKYKLEHMLEEIAIVEQNLINERRNVRLSKKEATQLLEYGDPNHVSRIGVPFDENGTIMVNDLKAWIDKNRPNRIKYFRKNIKDFR